MNAPFNRVTAFDKTIQKTSAWLVHVEAVMGWEDRHKAYMTLRAVLHALRDRLLPDEAAQLGAQLPMLVRGFYYEGWRPANKPLKYRHKGEFLEQVKKEAVWLDGAELERAVSGVLEVLTSELGEGGEIEQVRALLPAELRELWAKPGL
jgi:uncharacterized protein (DUF2267 family)